MIRKTVLALLLSSIMGTAVPAQDHSLKRNVVSSGGSTIESANYRMKFTNGQSLIGVASSDRDLKSGFWPKGGVLPEPVPNLSEWGMLLMGLLLLAFGTIAVVRKRKVVTNFTS